MLWEYASKGTPQLEVFSVIMHKHSPRLLNLYGSIRICNYVDQSIYKRERDDSECLPSESKCFSLLRDGVPQNNPCGDEYVFKVDLKHRVDSDVCFDEELCKGFIDKSYMGGDKMKFNELLSLRLDGKECSVEFGVGFYERAAKAHVKVTLINLKMKDIKVYGQITSQTSLILNASKYLFNKKFEDGITVHEHDGSVVLQLPTSLVVAPLDSELAVSANLHACGASLVSGTANFHVKEFGMSVGVISGVFCDIQVEVCWFYF